MENSHISSLVIDNLKNYFTYVVKISKLESHNFENIILILNNQHSSLLNFAFHDTTTTDCNEEAIIEVLEFLKQRKTEVTWAVDSHMKKLKSTLEKLGVVGVSFPKKAIVNIENYIIPNIPNLPITLDLVDNEAKLFELDNIALRVFHSAPGEVRTFFKGLANYYDIIDPRIKFFLVKYNNVKVGICGMYVQDKVVGFYSDGILPEYRNQGIASQMVLERIKIAKKQYACKYAIAQCMKPSVNLYRRLGFKMLGNLSLYTSLI
ncbi:GNAT family N-acetyltransferase [Ehrlichia ruminantium]|uniref:GNAT family N-acetyltransferase n=1 Tax=Ehrlichia ruminantium TaxID=779 RepID=UPI0015DBF985|nr:GNAT family N-acetyltransferase [Ehrlichia ruminantium]QLK56704.1 GNAT family N-acetyltransferase [Ehrlichia ruminantium]QLK57617.1 GNAT family N-acetyltransferase [Ehrlichia ruminantium]UOD98078.1 GNAT family N-acetyltransferase [Ehrlichia ruminantium]